MASFVLGLFSATMRGGGVMLRGRKGKKRIARGWVGRYGPNIFNVATLKESASQFLLSVNSKDDFKSLSSQPSCMLGIFNIWVPKKAQEFHYPPCFPKKMKKKKKS